MVVLPSAAALLLMLSSLSTVRGWAPSLYCFQSQCHRYWFDPSNKNIHFQLHSQHRQLSPVTSSQLNLLGLPDGDFPLPVAAISVAVVVAGALWASGAEDRAKKAQYADWHAQHDEYMAQRARKAYIQAREEPWTEEELKRHDGTQDNQEGPILIAVDGKVYNVWKGRHFYGPSAEYAIFAGRDATRLLAKFQTKEEDEVSLQKPLTIAEKATLQGYIYTFRDKYEVVGTLAGYDPKQTAF